jgi:hypothetical protein
VDAVPFSAVVVVSCEDGKSQEPPMPGAPIACSLLSEERAKNEY